MDERRPPRAQPSKENDAPDFLSDLARVKDKIGVTGIAAIGVALVAVVAVVLLSRMSG